MALRAKSDIWRVAVTKPGSIVEQYVRSESLRINWPLKSLREALEAVDNINWYVVQVHQ